MISVRKPQQSKMFGLTGVGSYFDDGITTHTPAIVGIKSLTIHHGHSVDSIQATYLLEDGSTWAAPRHGGVGGNKVHVEFEEGDSIIAVSAMAGFYTRINQLVLTVQKSDGSTITHGPFGVVRSRALSGPEDIKFSGKILGFTGWNDYLLNAIGFYYTQPSAVKVSETFGLEGVGSAFDDGITTHTPTILRIKSLVIRHGDSVDSIQATYLLEDGSTWVAPRHGGLGGSETHIEFEDGESIIAVNAMAGIHTRINQLTFTVRKSDGSRRNCGPFGKARPRSNGPPINIRFTETILGFTGRSDDNGLSAIGFYYTHLPTVQASEM